MERNRRIGYTGLRGQVARYVAELRENGLSSEETSQSIGAGFTPRQAKSLLTRRKEDLRESEQQASQRIRQIHLEVEHALDLVDQFLVMMRQKNAALLEEW